MSKKCKAYSESKLGMEPPDNRKAFYAGWDAAMLETDELLNVLERVYWIMKDDMPVELRSECFNTLDRCGVKV